MHFLYINWAAYARKDVLSAFTELGHTWYSLELSKGARWHLGFEMSYAEEILALCEKEHFDFAFSMNYFPPVSEACEKMHIPYISWIYDNPYSKAYFINIINPCNYIFSFDSAFVENMQAQNVTTVFYAPMAANAKRLSQLPLSTIDIANYSSDISFVGNLYNTPPDFYDEMLQKMSAKDDEYSHGYIDALILAQKMIYGADIITSNLPERILPYKPDGMPTGGSENGFFTTDAEIIADHALYRKLAGIERKETLDILSQNHAVTLYTTNSDVQIGNCQNKGYLDYMTEMPKVFRLSKINLNISLRSIKKGIPLRAMDIMGAGGFLLSNYQEDFLRHFEPDVDFVYYGSADELLDKVGFYLAHDELREQIAQHGLQTMLSYHTYQTRLQEMLSFVFSA